MYRVLVDLVLGLKQRLGLGMKFSTTKLHIANSIVINLWRQLTSHCLFLYSCAHQKIQGFLITSHILWTPNDADLCVHSTAATIISSDNVLPLFSRILRQNPSYWSYPYTETLPPHFHCSRTIKTLQPPSIPFLALQNILTLRIAMSEDTVQRLFHHTTVSVRFVRNMNPLACFLN